MSNRYILTSKLDRLYKLLFLLLRDKMIDVLVVGSEMVYVQQLLYYASSFSDRSILHGTGMSLCSLVRKEEGTQWIDGVLHLFLSHSYSYLISSW